MLDIARYRKTVYSAQIILMACYFTYSIVVLVDTIRLRMEFLDIAWETATTLALLNTSVNHFSTVGK